jgi:glycerol 3-phosphatase-2
VHRPADLVRAPAHQRPTYVAADLAALFTDEDARPLTDGADGWDAATDGNELVLRGSGSALDALRAVCAAAWRLDEPPARIRADGDAAAGALSELALG